MPPAEMGVANPAALAAALAAYPSSSASSASPDASASEDLLDLAWDEVEATASEEERKRERDEVFLPATKGGGGRRTRGKERDEVKSGAPRSLYAERKYPND